MRNSIAEIEKRWPSYRKNLEQLTANLKESSDLLLFMRKGLNKVKVKKNLISLKNFLAFQKFVKKMFLFFGSNSMD